MKYIAPLLITLLAVAHDCKASADFSFTGTVINGGSTETTPFSTGAGVTGSVTYNEYGNTISKISITVAPGFSYIASAPTDSATATVLSNSYSYSSLNFGWNFIDGIESPACQATDPGGCLPKGAIYLTFTPTSWTQNTSTLPSFSELSIDWVHTTQTSEMVADIASIRISQISAVPEPSSFSFLCLGLGAYGIVRTQRRGLRRDAYPTHSTESAA